MSLVVNSTNLNCNSLSYIKSNFMMMKLIIEILMLIVLCFIAFTLYSTEKENKESHNNLNVKLDHIQANTKRIAKQLEIDIIEITK